MNRAWIKLSEAAKLMQMTQHGAFKRLRRLQEAKGLEFLRQESRNGRWHVNALELRRYLSGESEQREQKEAEIERRIELMDRRLSALRTLNRRLKKRVDVLEHRRTTEKNSNEQQPPATPEQQ